MAASILAKRRASPWRVPAQTKKPSVPVREFTLPRQSNPFQLARVYASRTIALTKRGCDSILKSDASRAPLVGTNKNRYEAGKSQSPPNDLIAVRDRYRHVGGDAGRQLGEKLFHRRDGFSFGGAILLYPARYLTFEITIWRPKIA
jgi:hypothetical protein